MLVHREIKPYAGQVNTLLRGAGSSRAVSVGDWFALEQEYGEDVYSEALYQLTRLELPPDQARS